jgi:hypothetical protein
VTTFDERLWLEPAAGWIHRRLAAHRPEQHRTDNAIDHTRESPEFAFNLTNEYDIVGISGIIVNVGKVRPTITSSAGAASNPTLVPWPEIGRDRVIGLAHYRLACRQHERPGSYRHTRTPATRRCSVTGSPFARRKSAVPAKDRSQM